MLYKARIICLLLAKYIFRVFRSVLETLNIAYSYPLLNVNNHVSLNLVSRHVITALSRSVVLKKNVKLFFTVTCAVVALSSQRPTRVATHFRRCYTIYKKKNVT